METARSALNTVMENGATLQEANDWLALTLTKTPIQLHPNSNQLDPADVVDMANRLTGHKRKQKNSKSGGKNTKKCKK